MSVRDRWSLKKTSIKVFSDSIYGDMLTLHLKPKGTKTLINYPCLVS